MCTNAGNQNLKVWHHSCNLLSKLWQRITHRFIEGSDFLKKFWAISNLNDYEIPTIHISFKISLNQVT